MLETLKEEVCEQNHELPRNGLVVGSGGNVSGRDPETGLVVIKPSGVKFSKLTPDTMVVVDLDGNVVEGEMKPSVDTGIHLYVYRHRDDVFGMAHTHSPYASSFAARGERIPAVLTPITHIIGRDVPCSRYATPGEVDTGQAIVEAADGGLAVLVKSHGPFTMGKSATEAASIAMYLEEAAKTTHLAMLHGPVDELPQEEIDRCYKWFRQNYGQAGEKKVKASVMEKDPISQRRTGEKEAQLSNVALLYYGEGLTQGEIAKRMKVSRATVVNMLRDSRDLGIVDIRIDGKHLTGSSLARDLREKYGLQDVYVTQTGKSDLPSDRIAVLPQLARVAATAILDVVEPGDRVGVAWGETIMAVADVMPRTYLKDVQVCQLIGSMISERVPASENCAIQIANKLGADCFTLHAPGLISSAELATTFQAEPTIATQLDRLKSLALTISAIGNIKPDTHLVAAGIATGKELEAARTAGAVGVICCRYIDIDGQEVVMPPHDRLIAASIGDMRGARKRLLAVCGKDRGLATLAAIRGGLVTHLCIDQELGQFLMVA